MMFFLDLMRYSLFVISIFRYFLGQASETPKVSHRNRTKLDLYFREVYKGLFILHTRLFFLFSRSPGAVMTVGYQDVGGGDGQGLT